MFFSNLALHLLLQHLQSHQKKKSNKQKLGVIGYILFIISRWKIKGALSSKNFYLSLKVEKLVKA
jgi:hypothetical protein